MWSDKKQHTIGVTESGKPIMFHYHEEGFDARDHHEAATLHDRKRNLAAAEAARYKQIGYHGAANAYRKLAAHHGHQAGLHFANVLPAKNSEPATTPGNSTKPSSAALRPVAPKTAALKKADAPTKPQGGMVGYSESGDTSEAYFRTHEDALAHKNRFVGHPGTTCYPPHKVRLRDNETKEEYDGYAVRMKHWRLD